jgi:hypothetical protein
MLALAEEAAARVLGQDQERKRAKLDKEQRRGLAQMGERQAQARARAQVRAVKALAKATARVQARAKGR